MKKKFIVMALAAMLLIAVGVGGTLAWLTATDSAPNSFTVGNIEMTLLEQESEFTIIPGVEVEKEPIITILAESEPCYVYVKIENPMKGYADFGVLKDDAFAPVVNEYWKELDKDFYPGVYYYTGDFDTSNVDAVLDPPFTLVRFSSALEPNDNGTGYEQLPLLKNNEKYTITVTAYAVQEATFEDAQAAWAETFGKPDPANP